MRYVKVHQDPGCNEIKAKDNYGKILSNHPENHQLLELFNPIKNRFPS